MNQPQETGEQRAARVTLMKAQMRLDYTRLFTSEIGGKVLADLKGRYGWQGSVERPSARVGARAEDVFLTEGMKEPIRHILAMIESEDNKPTETKAIL